MIITVTALKGGVGKTTTALHLAEYLSRVRGEKTVLLDADPTSYAIDYVETGRDSEDGFRFDVFDAGGLRWAIDRALGFWQLPAETRSDQLKRIMVESKAQFNHAETARQYFEIYEKMLKRPFIRRETTPS